MLAKFNGFLSGQVVQVLDQLLVSPL